VIRRFVAVPAAAVALLAACTTPPASPAATRPPATDTLPCAKQPVAGTRSATPADVAQPPQDDPLPSTEAEQLQRQMQANRSFLDRHRLPDAAVPGAIRCTLHAEDALEAVTKKKTFTEGAIDKALTAQGLPNSTVRKPAAHDMGFGDGFAIANWTGQACIVGYVGPTHGYRVEYGSQIADGGCLAAPD
jgi:hypothetical protein